MNIFFEIFGVKEDIIKVKRKLMIIVIGDVIKNKIVEFFILLMNL